MEQAGEERGQQEGLDFKNHKMCSNHRFRDYGDYVKNVCKAIREVLGGYKIDIVTFYRNNNVFFSSTDCGWNLFFVNNMAYMQDSNLYKDVLSSNGYRRLVGTKNWHLFQQKKQKETDN